MTFILIICPYLAKVFCENNILKEKSCILQSTVYTITMIRENSAADAVNNLLWVSFQGTNDNVAFSRKQNMYRNLTFCYPLSESYYCTVNIMGNFAYLVT